MCKIVESRKYILKLDLAFNNVKPKDWYFVLDLVRFRTGIGCVRLTKYVSLLITFGRCNSSDPKSSYTKNFPLIRPSVEAPQ